ncbi:hypothetical protein [Streptomyces sp. NPDC058674]|uniref:hypothetical protein n=1 Tax=Streptomyces sp. NPDC058674 TaxID=3346592 RepID=UPI00365C9A48
MRTRTAFPALPAALSHPAALSLLAALGLLLLAPATALAHGDTVKVVVTGQREGRVTADVTWENDGDAVDEAVAATVNAVSADGAPRSLGPWRLIRDPLAPPSGWTTAEALPPGAWKVSVDVGFPALGHGELEFGVPVVDPAPATGGTAAVPPVAAPAASVSAPAPAPATAAAAPAPAASEPEQDSATTSGPALWWTTAGVAVTALTGAAAGVLLRRRRARRMR